MRFSLFKRIPCLLLIFLLVGCWDRREVNDVAFVSGSGVDWVKDQYRVSVQFPLPGQLGGAGSSGGGGGTSGTKSWFLDSASGQSLKDANNKQQLALSRQLYFAHRRVLVLGEEASRRGLAPIMDIVARIPQNRLSAFVVIAKGEAMNLMNVDVQMEKIPSEMIRELAVNSMRSPKSVKRVIHAVLSEGLDPVIPLLAVDKLPSEQDKSPKRTIKVDGLAIFKGDKLVGVLREELAQGVLWGMGEVRYPIVVIPAPGQDGETLKQAIHFTSVECQLKPLVQGDDISMNVNIKARGSVAENQSSYISGNDLTHQKLEDTLEKKIKGMVEKSVKVLQATYESDALGYGDTIFRKAPGEWHRLHDRWEQLYPKVKTNVSVHVDILNTGTIVKPIGRSDEEQSP